jgi:hypothetical protein
MNARVVGREPAGSTLESRLTTKIVRELRATALMQPERTTLPPPYDLDAEQALIGAALNGDVTPGDIPELRPAHFYGWLFRDAWEALDACIPAQLNPTPEIIASAVKAPRFAAELTLARDTTPALCPARARQVAARLIELHSQRELIDLMQQIDARLRTGTADHEQARDLLREHFRRPRP